MDNKEDKSARENFDLERIYDDEVAPLVSQITAICTRHKMPTMASFFYKADGEGEGHLCTTLINSFDGRHVRILSEATAFIQEGSRETPLLVSCCETTDKPN